MLKDITLGQYFPGNSFIHRLDPRVKIIWLVCYIVALFLAKNYWGYGLMLMVLVGCTAIARIKPAAMLRGLKPLLFIVIFTGIINVLYGTGEPLVRFWIFTITANGIQNAIFMVMRIMLLVCGTFLLTYTTTPLQLTDGLEKLLSPPFKAEKGPRWLRRFVEKIRTVVHELSMMMSIALRFIPTLIEETDKIMSAQRARGASFDTGKLTERAKALIPMLVPLFVSAFRRADELATAMECRCYHGGEGRTRMKQLKLGLRDAIALLCCAIIIVLMCLLR